MCFFLRKYKSSYYCSSSLTCKSSCNRVGSCISWSRKDRCKEWAWVKTISRLSFKFFIRFSVEYNKSSPYKWTRNALLTLCLELILFDPLCTWFKEVCVLYPLPKLPESPNFSGIIFSNKWHLRGKTIWIFGLDF